MAIERNFWVELFWRWHPKIYRWTGGRVGGKLANLPVLLIETVGRKTKTRRTTALTYLPYPYPEGGSYVVIASVLGEPKHPAWYLNLQADPRVAIRIGSQHRAVEARDAEGEEREAIWEALVGVSPNYEQYRERTGRRIPVVVLDRRSGR